MISRLIRPGTKIKTDRLSAASKTLSYPYLEIIGPLILSISIDAQAVYIEPTDACVKIYPSG